MISKQFSADDLRALAESRNYKLVTKSDHFWLVDRRDRLPIVNEPEESLYFTAKEAWALLLTLTPNRH